jgi:hypothetical protein
MNKQKNKSILIKLSEIVGGICVMIYGTRSYPKTTILSFAVTLIGAIIILFGISRGNNGKYFS